jgi:DNA-binding cell septation regulator SpoVG
VKEPKEAGRLSFFTSFFIEKENNFMSISVNDLVFYNYERQACVFKAGDLLHNFNGNDYRVMENYGNNNLLLMQMNTGMPAYKTGKGEYQDIAFPITKDFRSKLYGAVLDTYKLEREKPLDKAAAKDDKFKDIDILDTGLKEELPFR